MGNAGCLARDWWVGICWSRSEKTIHRPTLGVSASASGASHKETESLVVRSLAGKTVATLHVPLGATILQVKQQISDACFVSVYTQRLAHATANVLDNGMFLHELPRPLEVQLVRLPFVDEYC